MCRAVEQVCGLSFITFVRCVGSDEHEKNDNHKIHIYMWRATTVRNCEYKIPKFTDALISLARVPGLIKYANL